MRLKDKVKIKKSKIHGKGCFSKIHFVPGQFIGTFEGYTPLRVSKFVLFSYRSCRRGTNELRFINDSTNPNAGFDGYRLEAIKRIPPGGEITIDYGKGGEHK